MQCTGLSPWVILRPIIWMIHFQVSAGVIDNGGIALEHNYPYLMQDAWCLNSDHSSGVKLQAYVNVTPSEDALQVAVAAGPVAVAIDAALPEFLFYSSGIFYSPECKNDAAHLDHGNFFKRGWP